MAPSLPSAPSQWPVATPSIIGGAQPPLHHRRRAGTPPQVSARGHPLQRRHHLRPSQCASGTCGHFADQRRTPAPTGGARTSPRRPRPPTGGARRRGARRRRWEARAQGLAFVEFRSATPPVVLASPNFIRLGTPSRLGVRHLRFVTRGMARGRADLHQPHTPASVTDLASGS